MKGCIILYIVHIFSSSELVEPDIIPLKVRLDVALKKETKQENKNGTKKQKTASPGVEPGLSARSSNSLTTAPQ